MGFEEVGLGEAVSLKGRVQFLKKGDFYVAIRGTKKEKPL